MRAGPSSSSTPSAGPRCASCTSTVRSSRPVSTSRARFTVRASWSRGCSRRRRRSVRTRVSSGARARCGLATARCSRWERASSCAGPYRPPSIRAVEDRITAGLYLEMTDLPVETYARDRVPDVLACDGVQRATWWRNVDRDRTDLPRVLPEFDHLGVYEVEDAFVTPPVPAGITGHHFRHYRRPGQGIVTGRPTIGLSLVLISPEDAMRAQELRDWADFVHIRHIAEAAVPGYCMITPYENLTGRDPRFMHF